MGTLVACDLNRQRIISFNSDDLSYIAQAQDDPYEFAPSGLCNDGTNLFLSEAYHFNNITKRDISDLSTITSGVGELGSGDYGLQYPQGIAQDGTHLFIADQDNGRILKWTVDLVYVGEIADEGAIFYENPFIPMAVAVDDEFIYVVDRGSHRIIKRDKNTLAFVLEAGAGGIFGSGHGEFSNPYDICAEGGLLYVADQGNLRIQILNSSDLSYVGEINNLGGINIDFGVITGIASDGTYLYVSVGYLFG